MACNSHIPRNVAPSGLPTCLSRACCSTPWNMNSIGAFDLLASPSEPCNDVLSLKSCVTAMPILANDSDVRSQARKVRSAP